MSRHLFAPSDNNLYCIVCGENESDAMHSRMMPAPAPAPVSAPPREPRCPTCDGKKSVEYGAGLGMQPCPRCTSAPREPSGESSEEELVKQAADLLALVRLAAMDGYNPKPISTVDEWVEECKKRIFLFRLAARRPSEAAPPSDTTRLRRALDALNAASDEYDKAREAAWDTYNTELAEFNAALSQPAAPNHTLLLDAANLLSWAKGFIGTNGGQTRPADFVPLIERLLKAAQSAAPAPTPSKENT